MKKVLVVLIISMGMYAQDGITVVGGITMSKFKYNDRSIFDEIASDFKINNIQGFSISIEKMINSLKIGSSYVQRGTRYQIYYSDLFDMTVSSSAEIEMTLNYISGYILYPHLLDEKLSAFGGIQAGTSLGGTLKISSESENDSDTIESDELNLDYGLLLGLDYFYDTKIGLRASYYYGLGGVAKDVDENRNFKNRTIGLSLLYNL